MVWLCLLRHGQSQWNLENRFTGWVDIPLTDAGRDEARQAAQRLKSQGIQFDVAYSSVLVRVTETTEIALGVLGQHGIPVYKDQALNERHYGDLQGLNKAETAAKYGDEQVHIWRRSYDTPPPPLKPGDPRAPGKDPRYAQVPASQLPLTESLKETVDRVLPCWHEVLAPAV